MNIPSTTARFLFEMDDPWHPKWKPSSAMLVWFSGFLRMMRDGSVWAVPGTGTVYKISQKNKTLTLVHGNPNDPMHWHDKNRVTLEMLGWKVLDKEPPPDNPNEISLTASSEQIASNLLETNNVEDEANPFSKTKVTLQYHPFKHKDKWIWHWTLLPGDKSKALNHGSADSKALASIAARQAARKLGVVVSEVVLVNSGA